MSEPIRILLVDDHRLFADALTLLVNYESDLRMVEVARTAEEALATTAREEPDVILVDISLPGMDGLEAIPYIRECSPATHIVVLSAFPAAEQEALASGADVFVEKGTPVREIVATIKAFC